MEISSWSVKLNIKKFNLTRFNFVEKKIQYFIFINIFSTLRLFVPYASIQLCGNEIQIHWIEIVQK